MVFRASTGAFKNAHKGTDFFREGIGFFRGCGFRKICLPLPIWFERGAARPFFYYMGEIMEIADRVRALVEEKIAERPDLFIVCVKMHANGLLEILLDGDQGVAIEDCVQVSRHVGFHLEEENLIDRAYRIEVSSPGVDTPLLLHRQYLKNTGRNVRVKTTEGESHEGKLADVSETAIILEEKIKEKGKKAVALRTEIPFGSIVETKVLISFK